MDWLRFFLVFSGILLLLTPGCSSPPQDGADLPTNTPIPMTEGPTPTITPDGVTLGEIVSALEIDDDACPVEVQRMFQEDTSVIYVVAQNSSVPVGSHVMMRLYHNGSEEVDTQTLVADQDYQNICIFFEFTYDPEDGYFRRGEYAAQFFVNDVLRDTAYFVVQ